MPASTNSELSVTFTSLHTTLRGSGLTSGTGTLHVHRPASMAISSTCGTAVKGRPDSLSMRTQYLVPASTDSELSFTFTSLYTRLSGSGLVSGTGTLHVHRPGSMAISSTCGTAVKGRPDSLILKTPHSHEQHRPPGPGRDHATGPCPPKPADASANVDQAGSSPLSEGCICKAGFHTQAQLLHAAHVLLTHHPDTGQLRVISTAVKRVQDVA